MISQIREMTVMPEAPYQGNELSFRQFESDLHRYAHPCDALMFRDGLQSIIDYGNIHEVMWKSTLSTILAFDDNLQDKELSAEMQINDPPAALPYPVKPWLLFRRSNQVPYGRDYNIDYNMGSNAISVSKLHYRGSCRIRSRLRLGDLKLYNYDDNWRL